MRIAGRPEAEDFTNSHAFFVAIFFGKIEPMEDA
jgi:hypothetical protein